MPTDGVRPILNKIAARLAAEGNAAALIVFGSQWTRHTVPDGVGEIGGYGRLGGTGHVQTCSPTTSGSWSRTTPDTLTTRGDLARWRGAAGDPDGAATAYEQLLTDQLRILGQLPTSSGVITPLCRLPSGGTVYGCALGMTND